MAKGPETDGADRMGERSGDLDDDASQMADSQDGQLLHPSEIELKLEDALQKE